MCVTLSSGTIIFLIVDEGVMQLTGARVHAPLSQDQSTFFFWFLSLNVENAWPILQSSPTPL